MKTRSQQGVALVITLILLSVITFMAVTFLVVSRHEGANVDVVGQQSNAKFAADAAAEEAKAQIVASMLATANGLNFGLVVSTNYVSGLHYFDTQNNPASLTNVSYYDNTGALLSGNNMAEMLNNLQILPRTPVFVTNPTNKSLQDFRFYLDLNRNGAYDTNGLVVEKDGFGNVSSNVYVGDPEWVGILNHPDQRHSSSNLFVARYAFIAVPIGNDLDINYIHNQAKQNGSNFDGFLRNEGVGSWEINLAGFLNALNTNIWGSNAGSFFYTNSSGTQSKGNAFYDAAGILQYRYNGSYANLSNFTALYTNPAAALVFGNFTNYSAVDGYCSYPLLTGTQLPVYNNGKSGYAEALFNFWPGNNALNPFFTSQDFFNSSPYLYNFSNHLYYLGTLTNTGVPTVNSYNRYTYYRMLAQMGTDSAPEPSPWPYTNKLNLNYNNLQPVYSAALGNSTATVTNFLPWTALGFFTNAADRMLRKTFPNPVFETETTGAISTNYICITNIPIYPTNYYTPSVQRILQLAANIYDASTNKASAANREIDYPSVFRPLFDSANSHGIIRISGYAEVGTQVPVGTNANYLSTPLSLADIPTNNPGQFLALYRSTSPINVYGIPWIIGAKKGFPSFNQYIMQSVSAVTRKLQLIYTNGGYLTNVQYAITLTNSIGVQTWNSYSTSPYAGRPYHLYGFNYLSLTLSNDTQLVRTTPAWFTNSGVSTGSSGRTNSLSWSTNALNGFANKQVVVPFLTNYGFVTNEDYHALRPPGLTFTSATNFDLTGTNLKALLPQLWLHGTNRLQYAMIDNQSGRVIDYVHFDGMSFARNLIGDLSPTNRTDATFGGVWRTNFLSTGVMKGIYNQMQISMHGVNAILTPDSFQTTGWIADQLNTASVSNGIMNFGPFMAGNATNGQMMQAPFTPTAYQAYTYAYQVNDPLVHYTLGDLTRLTVSGYNTLNNSSATLSPAVEPAHGTITLSQQLNPDYMAGITIVGKNNTFGRYSPWNSGDSNNYNMAVKDPGVTGSDYWQFPTNKYPNIGWLGRVHRGTPWQTVFLKPMGNVPNWVVTNWAVWTGNLVTNYFSNSYTIANGTGTSGLTTPGYPGTNDAVITLPTNDWALLDLFTTAPNDNASRGQLSINQTNLAAWAAIFDGVIALTNTSSATNAPIVIDPTTVIHPPGYSSGITAPQFFVNSINAVRASTNAQGVNIYPGGVFTSLGQILSVPQLTVASPYVNTNSFTGANAAQINEDAIVERIPQQIMSLLRVGSPRYVIYAYGQALKPANNSIYQGSSYFGICTNYQITGEVATRTVLRIENYPVPGVLDSAGKPAVFRPRAVVESFNVLPPE